ncbi:MAG: hypothetical protein ACPLW9_01945 [Minisyncoccales bacterium]
MRRKLAKGLIMFALLMFALISVFVWYYFLESFLIYLFFTLLLGLIIYWLPVNPLVVNEWQIWQLEREKEREEKIKKGVK